MHLNIISWLNNQRKPVMVFFILAAACACNNAGKVPRGILPPAEMKAVLLDMQLAEAYNQQQQFAPDTISMATRQARQEEQLKKYYVQILELHHTNRGEFMNSYRYYAAHPDLLKQVYDQMTAALKQMRSRQDSLVAAKRKIEDSVRIRNDSLRAKKDTGEVKRDSLRLKERSKAITPKKTFRQPAAKKSGPR